MCIVQQNETDALLLRLEDHNFFLTEAVQVVSIFVRKLQKYQATSCEMLFTKAVHSLDFLNQKILMSLAKVSQTFSPGIFLLTEAVHLSQELLEVLRNAPGISHLHME